MAPEWLDGFDLAYREWGFGIWFLYAFAAYCAVGFVWFWLRLHALKRRIDAGERGLVATFNRTIEGFPNAVFAKMMGMGPLPEGSPSERSAP